MKPTLITILALLIMLIAAVGGFRAYQNLKERLKVAENNYTELLSKNDDNN